MQFETFTFIHFDGSWHSKSEKIKMYTARILASKITSGQLKVKISYNKFLRV